MVGRNGQSNWLSLSDASALLGVHASTLRRWADSGRVPCQRTPGGHRRFNREQLIPLVNGGSFDAVVSQEPPAAETQAWHAQFLAAGQVDTVRELGQRLSGIALQHLLRQDDDHRHLDEARALGRKYAEATRAARVDLLTAVEAFLFYRASLLPIVVQSGTGDTHGILRQVSRYEAVVSESLLGLVEGFAPAS